MQIISSYGVELRKQNIPIRQTLEIYRSAVSYLIGIYVQAWFFFVVCTRCSAALKRLFASGISANSSHTCT